MEPVLIILLISSAKPQAGEQQHRSNRNHSGPVMRNHLKLPKESGRHQDAGDEINN